MRVYKDLMPGKSVLSTDLEETPSDLIMQQMSLVDLNRLNGVDQKGVRNIAYSSVHSLQ